MKANELRIGNWIYSRNYEKELEMKSFYGLCNVESNNELFEPIPLTEEWLLKFGFIESLDNYFLDIAQRITLCYFDRNECQFSILQDGKEIALGFGAVKYVHQLQNLYFALTGEELTIKE